jgi:hypothetical protein
MNQCFSKILFLFIVLISIVAVVSAWEHRWIPEERKELLQSMKAENEVAKGDSLKDTSPKRIEYRNVAELIFPEIVDWKTFSHPELAFTFRYPKDWEIKSDRIEKVKAGLKDQEIRVISIGPTAEDLEIIHIETGFLAYLSDWYDCFGRITIDCDEPEHLSVYYRVKASIKCIGEELPKPRTLEEDKSKTADWKKYRNKECNFEIKYPRDFTMLGSGSPRKYYSDGGFTDYVERFLKASPVVNFDLPKDDYKKTNLMYAYLGIGLSKDEKVLCECLSNSLQRYSDPDGELVKVNGVIFEKRFGSDCAMGGLHNHIIQYNTFHNDRCYSVYGVIRSYGLGFTDEQIEAMEKGELFWVDKEKIFNRFEEIVSTFRFID